MIKTKVISLRHDDTHHLDDKLYEFYATNSNIEVISTTATYVHSKNINSDVSKYIYVITYKENE
jgi:hypothetical protein